MKNYVRTPKLSYKKLLALPKQLFGISSPDKTKIGYISDKSGRMELHVYDIASKISKQISHGEYPITPRFLHYWFNNDEIIFPKDVIHGNEKYDLYKISVSTGKVTQLTETPGQMDFEAKGNHKYNKIAFLSDRAKGNAQLFIMNPDGSPVQQITNHSTPVGFWSSIAWSPDDQRIAYSTNETNNMKNQDIYTIKPDGSDLTKLISIKEGSKDRFVSWSPDGKMIGFSSDVSGFDQPGVYHIDSGEIQWFGDKKHDEDFSLFLDDSKTFVTARNINASQKLFSYDLQSSKEKELKLQGFNESAYMAKTGRHILVGNQDSTHRLQFLLYDLDSDSYQVILPAEYGEFNSEKDFVSDEYFSYESTNNANIYSLLYKPKDIKSGEKFPALILPHGGPTGQYSRSFDIMAQIAVDHGYVILEPNVRGSTGYGMEFRDACINDWGGKDLDDIEYGVKYLKSLPYVDPERIGIAGGSYGGFMTFIALTKRPDLFKAGLSMVGITSIPLMYETNKKTMPFLNHFLEEQMGKPDNEETKQLWEDRSAINFVQNLKAKIKILHTDNDPRCPLDQA
ncbi:MAG: S9 family peptidase, partial [Candidatus Hodarchaeales archaeon]